MPIVGSAGLEQGGRTDSRGRLPAALLLFSRVLFGLTALSLLRAGIEFLRHHRWQTFEPLAPPGPGFDFFDYMDRMRFLHQPQFFGHFPYAWYYPAPGALAYAAFYSFCYRDNWRYGYLVLVITVSALGVFASFRLSRRMTKSGIPRLQAERFVFTSLLFSWPIYISLQRGNLESVIWFVLAAGLWAVGRERWMLAGLLIGLAASFKIYPVLCFALFLRSKRWKEIFAGLAVMGATTAAALRFLEPDMLFAFRKVIGGVRQWTTDYAGSNSPSQAIYDHSLFELVKAGSRLLGLHPQIPSLMHLYLVTAAIVFGLLFVVRVLWLPRANQVLFLIAAGVLLPPASFDYTLQNLYIPWAWIVIMLVVHKPNRDRWPAIAMSLFAIEMAPVTFVTYHHVAVGGLIKGVALVALVLLAAITPMYGSLDPPKQLSGVSI